MNKKMTTLTLETYLADKLREMKGRMQATFPTERITMSSVIAYLIDVEERESKRNGDR